MVGSPTLPTGELPRWVTLVRAANPGVMTLDGTNTWILRAPGGADAVVVDPGPDDPAHLAAVAAAGPVGRVLVTHGHPDHVDGLTAFRSRTGAALETAPVLRSGELTVTRLPTPGHTADSVCFRAEVNGEAVLLTGDTILGRGSTVVAWPDGDLGDYLASLELLSSYRGLPVLPGHGPPLADCGAAADAYLAHRLARLDQVRAAVRAGAGDATEVVAAVYADIDRSLWPAAEWSVRAQLAYLGYDPRESIPPAPGLDRP